MYSIYVLVVDDSEHILDFVVDYILKPSGFKIQVARDGAEGLHKAITTKPDLVIMDFEMPRKSGLEVLRALRAEGNKVPVILMTSHGSEQIAVEFFRLGVEDYIIKPFQPDEMLDAIENALSVTHLQKEKEALMYRFIEANKRLEQNIAELKTLYQISKTITSLVDPRTMLDRIVDAALFIVEGVECQLKLVDNETGEVKEHVIRQSGDISPDSQNEISFPLQLGTNTIGYLHIRKRGEGGFSEHDKQMLQLLAGYGAIGIQNRQFMYQLRQKKEEENQQIRTLFERYVAPSVVKQVLAKPNQVQLGGDRQIVAVIFADVRGFSNFSNHTQPETLVELLNQYIRVAAEAILAEEGTLDKFMGDAVMAFFNAPLPQKDYPLRAVRAALNIIQSVSKVHARLIKDYHLDFGIGVNIGEVVVGNIGTPKMMNFTVIGDTVNKTKRLQENAKGGEILISQETYHLVQNHVNIKNVGNLHLKGQPQPEPVYQVLSLKTSKGARSQRNTT